LRKLHIKCQRPSSHHDALVFFALALDEQLYDLTDDSFKAPALNTFSRTLELEVIAHANHSAGIAKDALKPFIEELEWSVAKDVALTPQQKSLCRTHLASMSENLAEQDRIARGVSGMRIVLGDYLQQIVLAIRNVIELNPDRKLDLLNLASSFIVQAEIFGFPRRHTYHVAQNKFIKKFKYSRAFDPKELLDRFFVSFSMQPKEYECLFIVEGGFARYPRLLQQFQIEASEVAPTWNKVSKDDKIFLDSKASGEKYIKVSGISARSPAAAHQRAQSVIRDFEGIVRFYEHKEILRSSAVSLVHDKSTEKIYRVNDAPDAMHCWVGHESSSEDSMLALFSVVQAGQHLKQQSTRRLQRAVRLHRSSLKSNSAENQLIGLWAGLEGLVARPGKESLRIEFFAQCLLPSLVLTYPEKLFISAYRDLRQIAPGLLPTVASLSGADSNFSKFIRIMLCDEHAAARAQMCDALVDSPLLLNKLWGIAKSFNTRAKVFDTLRGHRRKVRWHLSRIYHTRNSIVHDASAMPYLPTLVENLHVYVDSLIKAVQKTAMISPEHLTVDGALQFLSAWESYRLKALQMRQTRTRN